MGQILWVVLVVIVMVWLVGLITKVAGNLIHLLLIIGLALLVYNLVIGRRRI